VNVVTQSPPEAPRKIGAAGPKHSLNLSQMAWASTGGRSATVAGPDELPEQPTDASSATNRTVIDTLFIEVMSPPS